MSNPTANLEGFREKDFLEQITTLNDLAEAKDATVLPGLRELFDNPLGDASIDTMVVNALMGVIGSNEKVCVEGLEDSDPSFSRLCIRAAGEHGYPSAGPILIKLAGTETSPDRLHEIHTALAHINDPSSLDVFRGQMDSDDPLAQALAIQMIGRFKDADSQEKLTELIRDNAKEDHYGECSVATWKAVEALGAIGSDGALRFLADQLHHPNPTARRIITDTLVGLGEAAVDPVLAAFESDDVDQRVLCANVLGFLENKAGADGLLAAFDRGEANEPNVRYAMYEALGRIGTMKGMVCLVDGLKETDELILMAVVGGLERHVNSGVVAALLKVLTAGDDQAKAVAKAMTDSRGVTLFAALYPDPKAADVMMAAVHESRDTETLAAFRAALESLAGQKETSDRAKAHLDSLPEIEGEGRVALAADDSRSMLALHRSILSDMGFTAKLAADGREALNNVEEMVLAGNLPEVVITDLNMPVMDGLELVQKLRAMPECQDLPVVMVTTESESSQRDLASKAGVNAFVTKPFKPGDLKEAVTSVLGG